MNTSVVVVPVGDLNPEDLEYLKEELRAKFGDCTVANRIGIPFRAYNPQRGQYMSGILLQRLSDLYPDVSNSTRILGVAEEDLYSPGLNFIFGQAQLRGKCAVISVKRLDPVFYGIPTDRSIFRYRLLKEAVHELGHTLGLEHCSNSRCVMHFSNSIRDTDIKGDWLCKRCLSRFRERE